MKRLPAAIIFTISLFLTLPAHAGQIHARQIYAGQIYAGQMRVFVSIVPQKYFVLKIGAPYIAASVMVRPGSNPATYEPTPSQMVALAHARAYFAIGVPFETAWLPRIAAANRGMAIIHTDRKSTRLNSSHTDISRMPSSA